jgi:hypothetical protein
VDLGGGPSIVCFCRNFCIIYRFIIVKCLFFNVFSLYAFICKLYLFLFLDGKEEELLFFFSIYQFTGIDDGTLYIPSSELLRAGFKYSFTSLYSLEVLKSFNCFNVQLLNNSFIFSIFSNSESTL